TEQWAAPTKPRSTRRCGKRRDSGPPPHIPNLAIPAITIGDSFPDWPSWECGVVVRSVGRFRRNTTLRCPGRSDSMPEEGLTQALIRLRDGDVEALDRLLPLVYDELRTLARSLLRNESPGHTLGATALVHEAYLRLANRNQIAPQDRSHFFAIA